MTYRLLALDIDGTLLDARREISPTNAEAVARARRAGLEVVLASGRIRPSIAPFAEALKLGAGPRICANGAHVVGRDGENLSVHCLAAEERDAIVRFAFENGLHLNAYTTDVLYFTPNDGWSELYRRRTRLEPQRLSRAELAERDFLKLMFVGGAEQIRETTGRIAALLSPERVRITESEPEYLEFLSPQADKGLALQSLAAELGVPREAVAAIGDYLNDLEMLRWAGLGVAMGNAPPEVRAAADWVAPSNEEAGVAWAIDRLLE